MKNPSKKELLKSPTREWDDTSRAYDQILLIPAGTMHDSGFMRIAIIGVFREGEEVKYEICGWPDDITCLFPLVRLGDNEELTFAEVRMDCIYPSGVLQYHGRGKFKVSEALSSMEITFMPYRLDTPPQNPTLSH